MDEITKIIKELLSEAVKQSGTPAISMKKKMDKEEKDINEKAYKETDKKFKDYDKFSKQKTKEDQKDPVKRNLNDKEKEYHDQIELSEDNLDLTMDEIGENEQYADRVEKAIVGDATMGNRVKSDKEHGDVAGVVDNKFGETLIKNKLARKKNISDKSGLEKRAIGPESVVTPLNMGGLTSKDAVTSQKTALEMGKKTKKESVEPKEVIKENEWPKEVKKGRFTEWCKKNGFEGGASISCAKKAMQSDDTSVRGMASFYMNTVKPHGKDASAVKSESVIKESDEKCAKCGKILRYGFEKDRGICDSCDVNEPKQNSKNNISTKGKENIADGVKIDKKIISIMKKLTFKTPFNGREDALNKIPDKFKVNLMEFVMTDKNETYKVRWEENKPVILEEENKKTDSDELKKMKHLMNFKSSDTTGTLSYEQKRNEDKVLVSLKDKTQKLLEEGEEKVPERTIAVDKDIFDEWNKKLSNPIK